MRKKVWLHNAAIKGEALYLEGESKDTIQSLKATGQVVVDSDELSFVYLAEEGDDYTYLYLPDFIWPQLKEALDQDFPVIVNHQDITVELENIKDEILYLVSNIEGNSNYGDEMVEKVEKTFL